MYLYLPKELNADEKAKPYSKYFYRRPAMPDMAKVEAMKRPIDPAKALKLENLNDLLNPGYLESESGWCILDSGAGYVSNHTKMPGVTPEMFKWWFAWHSLEPMRYRLWWPEGHASVMISDEDRAKILDPGTPLADKYQGITHHVLENVGGGYESIWIRFMKPEDCGFDMGRFKSPNIGALAAANGVSQFIEPPPGVPNHKSPAFMCHVVREIDGGIELRTRFWLGMHVVEKKPVHLLPEGVRLPPPAAMGLAIHNVFEFTNLAGFLPELYREMGGKVA